MADQIVDACCLINLYASGRDARILQACRGVFVPDHVRGEALTIPSTRPRRSFQTRVHHWQCDVD